MRKGMFSVLRKANLMSFFFKGGGKNLLSLSDKKWLGKQECCYKNTPENLDLLVQKKS